MVSSGADGALANEITPSPPSHTHTHTLPLLPTWPSGTPPTKCVDPAVPPPPPQTLLVVHPLVPCAVLRLVQDGALNDGPPSLRPLTAHIASGPRSQSPAAGKRPKWQYVASVKPYVPPVLCLRVALCGRTPHYCRNRDFTTRRAPTPPDASYIPDASGPRHLVQHCTTRRTSPTRRAPTPCTTLYDASYSVLSNTLPPPPLLSNTLPPPPPLLSNTLPPPLLLSNTLHRGRAVWGL